MYNIDDILNVEPQLPDYHDVGPEPSLIDLIRIYYTFYQMPDVDELVEQYIEALKNSLEESYD